ncbi:MAG: hypothetical protein RSE17_03855 [Bacilli bacterium]
MEIINKSCYNKSVDELTKLELFVKGITSNSKEIIHQLGGVSEFMAKFESVIERLNNDGKILGEYDKEETDKILYNTGVNAALEQGIEQGVEQGAKQKTINIALEMLRKNLDITLISEITKLSLDEISKLKY